MTTPQTTDPRPMRDYPCPHCGGMGEVVEDRVEYWPITRPCGYCEGRGCFTRPVLPRGAVRAFAVLWDEQGSWDDPEAVTIFQAASAAKAKMQAARLIGEAFPGDRINVLRHLRVRRAPAQDGEAGE